MEPEAVLIGTICAGIEAEGHAVIDQAFAAEFMAPIVQTFELNHLNRLQPAGMGRLQDVQYHPEIRGDHMAWLSAQTPDMAHYFTWCENLRLSLNRQFYLGLFEYESMFAEYPINARYLKHLDAFNDPGQPGNNRRLSTVLYLNPDWPTDGGGELMLYRQGQSKPFRKVLPEMGTLVVFLSEDFPHEVLPAKQARRSLTGWFRTKA